MVESPVPPPTATTRNPRLVSLLFGSKLDGMDLTSALLRFETRGRQVRGLGVEQFGETRIIRHVLKIGIIARLKPVRWVQSDGLAQVLQRTFHLPGQPLGPCHALLSKVSLGILLKNFFH